ncbi:MAG: hypothetical protein HN509_02855 [Halobacteriovoraceae bacterium]|jgi:hypothetical protein|nr:hypothetical protein [Halobacteriovoraceae bacterium]MBT5096001.1 hypothetical protein [Halobacteriovoraceae bacterium]
MLIEVGPRSIGRCELNIDGCTGKSINIIKKVLLAEQAQVVWVCQKCLHYRAIEDRKYYQSLPRESSPR